MNEDNPIGRNRVQLFLNLQWLEKHDKRAYDAWMANYMLKKRGDFNKI